MKKQALHIVFHNPNTEEETAKFLARLIAQSMADAVIKNQFAGIKKSGTDA